MYQDSSYDPREVYVSSTRWYLKQWWLLMLCGSAVMVAATLLGLAYVYL